MQKCFIGATSIIVDNGDNIELKYYLIGSLSIVGVE